jgi:hypothetical protein
MTGNHRISWTIIAILVIVVGAGLGVYYYFFHAAPTKELAPVEEPAVQKPPQPAGGIPPAVPPQKPGGETPQIVSAELGQSDEPVREWTKTLSPHPQFAEWLQNKNMIRRITAAIVNMAEGRSPRAHLNFLSPPLPFSAIKKGERLYLDPKSYDRYNLIAEVFASLDAQGSVRVYKAFYKLFQTAYGELGYPDRDFQDYIFRAIKVMLRTPVVEGEIEVEEEILYRMVDDHLEDLNEVQKHLIRMGPQNTQKIQAKLREMALALGLPENQLPKTKIYSINPK